MSTTSRKERRKLLAARHATTPNPAQSRPTEPVAPPPIENPVSPNLSADQLDALLTQFETLGGMSHNDLLALESAAGPEFAEFASRLNFSDGFNSPALLNPDREGGDVVPPQTPAPRVATGPTSEAGKARSAQNSFKHGLAASFSQFKLLPGEDPREYAELLGEVRSQFVPRTTVERHKIDDMAQAWWLQRRARNLQTSALESGDDKALALYLRYETTQRRSYQMAYKDFEDMKKHRLANAASPDLTPVTDPGTFQSQPEYPSQTTAQPVTEAPEDHPLAA